MVRMAIDGSSNAHVVILQEKGGERLLPIWIGAAEADSILMEINNVRKERPLTHDLCKSLIAGLGGELRRVPGPEVSAPHRSGSARRRAASAMRHDRRNTKSVAAFLCL